MSTSYYGLRKPFSKLELIGSIREGGFKLITDKDSVCTITKYHDEDLAEILYEFIFDTDREPVMHGYYGGVDKGSTLIIKRELEDDYYVLSEYNELMTVKEVKDEYQTIEKEQK